MIRSVRTATLITLIGLAGCESVPNLRFVDQPDAAAPHVVADDVTANDGVVLPDGGTGPDAGVLAAPPGCPDVAPLGGICCGSTSCIGCTPSSCGACEAAGCGAGLVCCPSSNAKGNGNGDDDDDSTIACRSSCGP
jgi:hypothetical protein